MYLLAFQTVEYLACYLSFSCFIIQRQQNLEEHEPLSSAFDGSSPASAIVAVDTNLDTSTPDTYRAPPAPLPYDVVLAVPDNPGK
jgi:hypothetical protein